MASNPHSPLLRRHGWAGTETVKTRLGDFDFRNSYPAGDTAQRLRDALTFNRAVEVFLSQMHGVSWYRVWKGIAQAGSGSAEPGGHLGNADGLGNAAADR